MHYASYDDNFIVSTETDTSVTITIWRSLDYKVMFVPYKYSREALGGATGIGFASLCDMHKSGNNERSSRSFITFLNNCFKIVGPWKRINMFILCHTWSLWVMSILRFYYLKEV